MVCETYDGPISSLDAMVASYALPNLGLTVFVGPSKVAPTAGLGLFVAVSEDSSHHEKKNQYPHQVKLLRSTPLFGYSTGTFTDSSDGDKTVAYLISSIHAGVVYDDKVRALDDVLEQFTDKGKLTHRLEGHLLLYDEELEDLVVIPNDEFKSRYFVPDATANPCQGVDSIGIFANDLAYDDAATQDVYNERSKDRNILSIIWRLKDSLQRDDDCCTRKLQPAFPVIISNKDLLFVNSQPMEIGLHYSWRFWDSFRHYNQLQRNNSKQSG
jgi:hypothetical protein